MGARCSASGGGCDGREDSAVEALMQWQKVSDFLIGASYMSIPLELLHFATCADLAPLRWVLLQFGAFIVLCGVAHLAAVLACARPDSRRLLAAVTAAKALAAAAASVAAVSLPTFVPQLLRLKTREALLRDKARQLDRDVALVRRREETAARVARAVTHRIVCRGGGDGGGSRGSLAPDDALAVLRTAVFHLSDALGLSSCAVWMPAAAAAAASEDGPGLLHLVHYLPEDEHQAPTMTARNKAVRITDPDVAAVMATKDAKVLRPGSSIGTTTPGHELEAAIRLPVLRASNFVEASSSSRSDAVSYAIMVLVLPGPPPATKNHKSTRGEERGAREWSREELEIVEIAADQLAVALSHAAVLEEWRQTRHRLAERQKVVAQARHDAAAATRARDAAQSAMRDVVLRPMHSVAGLLSLMQDDGAFRRAEQRVAVDAMARISALSSTLTDDVTAASGVSLARRPFDPRALVRDAAGVAGCLARCRGLGFSHRAEMGSLPAECWVVGDDRRVFHLLLHMLGVLLDRCECHCHDLCFAVDAVVTGDQEQAMPGSGPGLPDWITPTFSGGNTVCVRFRFGITRHVRDSLRLPSSPRPQEGRIRRSSSFSSVQFQCPEMRLSIATCNKIVQMMNGKMWRESTPESRGQYGEHMSLILHFHLGYGVASPSASSPSGGGGGGFYSIGGRFGAPSPSSSTSAPPHYNFNGLRVLLSDSDDTSREVTRKLLERLGCQVLPVPSAAHCLSLLLGSGSDAGGGDQPSFQFPCLQLQAVLLDLHTPATASADAATASAMDDGFQVALRIREVTGDRFSWLLILVALPLPPRASCIDVRDVCKRTGVNGVIYKPMTLPALAAQLYRVLHN